MTGEKSNKIRDTRVSQAPEPPSPISTGGYRRPSNTPARYEYWNHVPAVTIDQFTYLIFGCDPGTKLIMKTRQKRADLLLLIHAHEAVDTFPKPIDPWAANPLYAAVELIEWAEPLGYRAKDWKPINVTAEGGPRYEEAVAASIHMVDDLNVPTPTTLDELYEYMINNKERFPINCGPDASLDIESIKRQVRREAKRYDLDNKSPLKDLRFRKKKAEADKK